MDEEIKSTSPTPQETQEQVTLTFYDALREVVEGKRITRVDWHNENIYGMVKDGQLMIFLADGLFHQWIINDGDLTAIDWIVLPEGN